MPTFNVLDYGAAGDGTALDTAALQGAVDACASSGGGRVLVPGGKAFLSGTVRLKSRVELHLEGGAEILGSERIEDYSPGRFRALLEACDADGVAVTGLGTLDGRAHRFMTEERPYIYRAKRERPHLLLLEGCTGVTLTDITIKNAANWGVHPVGCEDVVIRGLRILNDLKVPNCDGIDPDHCRNVRISDCHIEAGDDCIVLKNRAEYPEYGPTENVTVTGCTLVSTSAAVKIGTESVGDFRNIVFQGCIVHSSNRGLAVQLRDQGNVENVLFANSIVESRLFYEGWWGKAEPIYVTAIPRAPGRPVGRVRNVRFSNILCRSENGAFLAGSEGSPLEDVVLEGVRIEVDKWSKWPGGWHDRRPCMSPDTSFGIDPAKDAGLHRHPTAGVYIEHARGVTLRNSEVVWGEAVQEYWRHALEAHAAEDLRLENFRGEAAHPGRDEAVLRA